MRNPILATGALALAAATLGGCAYDSYGYGGGFGLGIGGGDYYGAGYDYAPYGWYGDYYYPGVGAYVYDRGRHRHAWNGDQQRYWGDRTQRWHQMGRSPVTGENWSGMRGYHGRRR
ncbi:hypothetical protein [Sphingomonas ginkgonis]|uniref:hypothetical protein n=1 Tax=Sphingomonas ginkgonis TaxID=2315330 RepID=UPI00163AA203|nr:hypothetical protein [Sphingomonas ginkgonis]